MSKPHEFWDTQPVPRMSDDIDEEGAYETKTVADVQPEPYTIASVFEWYTPDVTNEDELKEIYELLAANYVEDDDSIFRFNYSPGFLKWALTPPGFYKNWHVAVRKKSDKKMLAFISGIPCNMRMDKTTMVVCEINFLCIHKLLRAKRLAPIMIKEVTRRVNLENIWQAIYTAGIELPKPFAKCQYFHRSLNPQKLVAIGFSRVPHQYQRFQKPMDLMKRHYQLPDRPQIAGFREMVAADVPAVSRLMVEYLAKFKVSPAIDDADVAHWVLPRDGIVYAYVVENGETGEVTDFVSFYNLPSSVLGNAKYTDLKAAYAYYYYAKTVDIKALIGDALIMAKKHEFDVFNTLNILDNQKYLTDLKFGQGDGFLRYYMYNWKFPAVQPHELGLVML
jgi:glycylpeptide N-tetradecanoyltransferase